MTNQQEYLNRRVQAGWGLLALGALLFAAGLVLQFLFVVPFNARIVSGLGIFFASLGLGQVLRYRATRSNRQAVARLINEEHDERNHQIRRQAGSRGYWVSLAMTYAALMWLSFASSGSLPTPTPDGLWYYLAAAVIVPFTVYAGSILYEQQHG
jgi:hypothetical protein